MINNTVIKQTHAGYQLLVGISDATLSSIESRYNSLLEQINALPPNSRFSVQNRNLFDNTIRLSDDLIVLFNSTRDAILSSQGLNYKSDIFDKGLNLTMPITSKYFILQKKCNELLNKLIE